MMRGGIPWAGRGTQDGTQKTEKQCAYTCKYCHREAGHVWIHDSPATHYSAIISIYHPPTANIIVPPNLDLTFTQLITSVENNWKRFQRWNGRRLGRRSPGKQVDVIT
jgi:hypothetical protein